MSVLLCTVCIACGLSIVYSVYCIYIQCTLYIHTVYKVCAVKPKLWPCSVSRSRCSIKLLMSHLTGADQIVQATTSPQSFIIISSSVAKMSSPSQNTQLKMKFYKRFKKIQQTQKKDVLHLQFHTLNQPNLLCLGWFLCPNNWVGWESFERVTDVETDIT